MLYALFLGKKVDKIRSVPVFGHEMNFDSSYVQSRIKINYRLCFRASFTVKLKCLITNFICLSTHEKRLYYGYLFNLSYHSLIVDDNLGKLHSSKC